ncbi:MAG: ribbon-helix-helix domain-containing protein [Gammaproteobacteria bacterium]|nr:ribbon-helix-helix domain-containing protein [Gammaproteobacteria bacterium]
MITLRLDPKLEKTINDAAHRLGLSKSELIRKSVTEYINKLEKPSPWELGNDIFGKYASGQDNLSKDRKALFKEKIRAEK